MNSATVIFLKTVDKTNELVSLSLMMKFEIISSKILFQMSPRLLEIEILKQAYSPCGKLLE